MNFSIKHYPKCWAITVWEQTAFGDTHRIPFADPCGFLQLNNLSAGDVFVRLNDDPAATFTLYGHTVQTFDYGELSLTSIDFANTASGGSAVDVDIIAGLVK